MDKIFTIFVYTFGTRNYALEVLGKLDPEEKVLKKSRLISRTDFNLNHKELAKIIPGAHHDCIIILDDTRTVWHKYLNNLIQVVPFYHFVDDKKSEKIFTVKPDDYLHFLSSFLTRANRIAKKVLESGRKVKIQKIVRKMHDTILAGKTVAFTSVFPKGVDPLIQEEAKLIRKRGGKVVSRFDEETASGVNLVLTKSFKKSKKFRLARSRNINFCNILWLRYSIINLVPLETNMFNPEHSSQEDLMDFHMLQARLVKTHSFKKLLKLGEEIDQMVLKSILSTQKPGTESK